MGGREGRKVGGRKGRKVGGGRGGGGAQPEVSIKLK